MTTINVVDGTVTLFVTVSAEYTNEETEPILSTEPVRVPRDHPLVRALVDIWHLNDQGDGMWAEDPRDDPQVRALVDRLAETLATALLLDL
jgi:hypothetical protein